MHIVAIIVAKVKLTSIVRTSLSIGIRLRLKL